MRLDHLEKPLRIALFYLFPLCGLLAPAGISPVNAQDEEDHLRISVEVATDTLGAGAASELLVTFRPKKGFHVNAVPRVGFELDSGVAATLADSVVVPRDTTTGYMDTREPVRQPFTLLKSAAAGRTELSGTLTYYYCSDKEGWCRRVKIPFSRNVVVR